ncbi:MAG TPA: sigma-70 family RNA polymerase sigma factor [Anaerolineae bacterium]|nr:sigma-70 family RNA polymerase sigma factor [Anaerolineae bacterium]
MPSHADWAAKNIGETLGDEMLVCLASPLVWAGAASDEVADPDDIDPTGTVIDCLDEAEEVADQDLLRNRIGRLLEYLSPRQRQVLELRFGLNDGQSHTLEETAQLLGVCTRERIRQIEAKALRHLRHPRYGRELRDFVATK